MPTLAWVEQQRTAKRVVLAGLRLEIAQDCTRERIAESGRVREDVPNGRRPGCRAEPIDAARSVERFEDLLVCKLRQILFDRIVESEAACSTICMAAVDVIGLVIEAMRNSASAESAR